MGERDKDTSKEFFPLLLNAACSVIPLLQLIFAFFVQRRAKSVIIVVSILLSTLCLNPGTDSRPEQTTHGDKKKDTGYWPD